MTAERLQRQLIYKKRQKAGVWVAPALVSFEMIDHLIQTGRLSPVEAEDRAAIGRAVTELAAEALDVKSPVDQRCPFLG